MRGNDWRSLPVAPVDGFEPSRPVSVVIPYYEAPEALALTLAGLQLQTYPQELFDVIVVDDGSSTPLRVDAPAPLRVQVIHQSDQGFGAARARNNGARAASGEILVFLDCDMVPEAGWLTSHARWHHVACDVLTLGFRKHVDVDGITAAAVRRRPGSLGELFAGRQVEEPQWIESRMARTDLLTSGDEDIFRAVTSGDEDIFRAVTSGNLGVSVDFFAAAGGFDESFNQSRREPRMQGKLMNLIPHGRPRDATGGRFFSVPRFVVTVTAVGAVQRQDLGTVQQMLSSTASDLVVWIQEPPGASWSGSTAISTPTTESGSVLRVPPPRSSGRPASTSPCLQAPEWTGSWSSACTANSARPPRDEPDSDRAIG